MKERYVITIEGIGYVTIISCLIYALGFLITCSLGIGVGLVIAAQIIRTR